MCWFSTTNAAEGPEDLLKSGSKLNGLPGHHEASRENGVGASTDDSNEKIFGAGDNINFKCLDTDNSGLNHLSFGNGFDTQSESADDLMFNEVSGLFVFVNVSLLGYFKFYSILITVKVQISAYVFQ